MNRLAILLVAVLATAALLAYPRPVRVRTVGRRFATREGRDFAIEMMKS